MTESRHDVLAFLDDDVWIGRRDQGIQLRFFVLTRHLHPLQCGVGKRSVGMADQVEFEPRWIGGLDYPPLAILLIVPMGLLFGFVVGHLVLFVGMWVIVAAGYPSSESLSFGFFDKKTRYPSLMIIVITAPTMMVIGAVKRMTEISSARFQSGAAWVMFLTATYDWRSGVRIF